MKFKAYLWSLLTIIACSMTAVGCSDSDDEVVTPQPDPQPEKPQTEMTFQMEVSNVAAHSADFKVIPSDAAQTFAADVLPAAMLDKAGVDKVIEMTLQSVKPEDLMKGETKFSADKLDPETEYVLFAVGVENAKATTKLATKRFTTLKEEAQPEPEGQNNKGEVIDMTAEQFNQWIYDVKADAQKANFLSDIPAVIDFYGPGCGLYLEDIFAKLAKEFNGKINFFRFNFTKKEHKEVKEYMDVKVCPTLTFITKGKADKYLYEKQEGDNIQITEAEIRAMIEEQFGIKSEAQQPEKPEVEQMTFELSVTNLQATAADLKVVPSNMELMYYTDAMESAAFEGMTEQQKIDEILANYGEGDTQTGVFQIGAAELEGYFTPDTEYTLFALGYNQGQVNSKLFTKTFRTLKDTPVQPEDPELPVPQGYWEKKDGKLNNMNEDSFRYYVWDYENFPVGDPLQEKIRFRGERPVVVDYGAIAWCGNCQRLHPNVEEIAKKYAGEVDVFYMDSDDYGFLKPMFGISGIPRLFFFSMKGDVYMEGGVPTVDEISNIINDKLIWTDGPNPDLQAPEIKFETWAGDQDKQNTSKKLTAYLQVLSQDAVSVKSGAFAEADYLNLYPDFEVKSIYDCIVKYGFDLDNNRLGFANSAEGTHITYGSSGTGMHVFIMWVKNEIGGVTVKCNKVDVK